MPKPRPGLPRILSIALIVLTTALGSAHADPLRIMVSVLPLKTFVEQVGGDRVQVEVMVPPGHSPATYDPSPRQVAALADADLYVRVGMPFEAAWMRRFLTASPGLAVLDLREGIPLRPMPAHDHDDHGDHDEPDGQHEPTQNQAADEAMDPHIWTSPRRVMGMSRAIAERLTQLDPAGADLYSERQRAFAAELAALDQSLRQRLADLTDRRFLVFHPAWGYFADDYGLEQVPIEHEGKAPGPRRLAALIDQARADGIRVIFVQPQFDRRAAARVAQAIDGQVVAIDPLATDYANNLKRVADALVAAEARRGDPTLKP